MKTTDFSEVTLDEMLAARERRADLQARLISEYHVPLVSFTLNIPGPVKMLPHVPDAFETGRAGIHAALEDAGFSCLAEEIIREKTGWEAFFCVDAEPELLKRTLLFLEDESRLGRLYDIDIIRTDKTKVSREDLELPGRTCLLCGEAAHVCARSRKHSVKELTAEISSILEEAYGKDETSWHLTEL